MNKDIVLVTSNGKKSGVYRVEQELIIEWKKQGHVVSLINANGKIIHDTNQPLTNSVESKIKPFALIQRFIRLRVFFRKHKHATVVALSLTADCFAALFGLTIKNKIVVSERNDPAQYPESRIYRLFRNFCFTLVNMCVFQTQEAREYFSQRIQKKGVIIPNPINPDIPEFGISEREKVIVSAGRLKEQKNFPMLINAFSIVYKTHPDFKLEIYGSGELQNSILELIAQLGLKDKVSILPYSDKIWSIMARASVFVMSSNYEGISNSMLESLAIGTPTICTDCPVGGAREVIQNGINGLLVPVGDVDALACAICNVIEDEQLRRKLEKNGPKIRKQFPIDKIAQRWIDIF